MVPQQHVFPYGVVARFIIAFKVVWVDAGREAWYCVELEFNKGVRQEVWLEFVEQEEDVSPCAMEFEL